MVTLTTIPAFNAAVQVGQHAIGLTTCSLLPSAGHAVDLHMGPLSLSLSENEAEALAAELARAVERARSAGGAA